MENVECVKIAELIASGEAVRVYLRNGICLRGQITQQDDKVLVLQALAPTDGTSTPSEENILYKAAVSTIRRTQHAT